MHRRFQPLNSVCASSYCIKLVSDQQFHFSLGKLQTSWEQPKPAPYLRLKNSKRNSKCQSIGKLGTLLFLKKVEKKSLTMPKQTERGTLWHFSTSILSENIKKLKEDTLAKFFSKKSPTERAENTLREYPLAPLSFLDDVKILRKLLKN